MVDHVPENDEKHVVLVMVSDIRNDDKVSIENTKVLIMEPIYFVVVYKMV